MGIRLPITHLLQYGLVGKLPTTYLPTLYYARLCPAVHAFEWHNARQRSKEASTESTNLCLRHQLTARRLYRLAVLG
jgi:hypothetical protein